MTLLALYSKYVQYMNMKKPTQSQAKNPNLLANHVGYKKYRISSGLGHAPNHRVSSLYSDVSQHTGEDRRPEIVAREHGASAVSLCGSL